MQTLTITLAGKEYTVQPVTVGQVEDIQEALLDTGDRKALDRRILAIALGDADKEITLESLRGLRVGSVRDLQEAVRAVLEFAGFARPKESGDAKGAEGGPAQGEATGA